MAYLRFHDPSCKPLVVATFRYDPWSTCIKIKTPISSHQFFEVQLEVFICKDISFFQLWNRRRNLKSRRFLGFSIKGGISMNERRHTFTPGTPSKGWKSTGCRVSYLGISSMPKNVCRKEKKTWKRSRECIPFYKFSQLLFLNSNFVAQVICAHDMRLPITPRGSVTCWFSQPLPPQRTGPRYPNDKPWQKFEEVQWQKFQCLEFGMLFHMSKKKIKIKYIQRQDQKQRVSGN